MTKEMIDNNYSVLLQNLKKEITQARIKAHLSVNKEMIVLYWKIGNQILQRQKQEGWGSKVIENISKDLRKEFPEMTGLGVRNLKYMRKFAYLNSDLAIVQEALAQITWYHNITHIIFDLFVENEITAIGMLAEVDDIIKKQNIELIVKLCKNDLNYQKKLANFGVKNFLIKPFTWDRLIDIASDANVI